MNLSPTWTTYSADWIADSSTCYENWYFRGWSPGNIYFTDVSVEDVTPSILTGTVTNGVSGNPVSGAAVKASSGTQTFTTTSNSSGVYSFSGINHGAWNVSANASGYNPYHSAPNANTYNVMVNGSTTLDISMMPSDDDPASSWSVYDTFDRADNSSLGTTEDSNLVPWVKTTANANSSILGHKLLLNPSSGSETSYCGAYLGRGFAPANFDMSVTMTWEQSQSSQWAGIAYRQTESGVYHKGYFLCCTAPSYDDYGNANIELKYNDAVIASAPVSLGSNGWLGAEIQLKVSGSRHTVLFNGEKMIDVIDSQNMNGGYVGLFCDYGNCVYWDSLNMSSSTVVESVTKPVIQFFDFEAAGWGDGTKRYDIQHAVACIQGLANRVAPRVMVTYFDIPSMQTDDSLWLNRLTEPGGLCEGWTSANVTANVATIGANACVGKLIDTYRSLINGVVVYDDIDGVFSTSLAATTAAACENAIAVRKDTSPDSLYTYLTVTKGLPVLIDLSGKFTGTGTIWGTNGVASSGSAKCDAYIWAKVNYLDTGRCNPTVLSYTLDEYALSIGRNDMNCQLSNLDYAVQRKAFCFDLSPWGDETPLDDRNQPVGTDRNTYAAILSACNVQTGSNKMIEFCGFPIWDCKYTSDVGGGHSPSSTEYEFIKMNTSYNAYSEPTAPSPCWVTNSSFYYALKPEVMQRRYVNNPPPKYSDMVSRGLINASGTVPDGNYIMMGLGDYDGPAWILNQLGYHSQKNCLPIWDDSNRGQVYCNWGIDPNLIDRASVAFDYFYRHKTDHDFFICWDAGAGYLFPSQLSTAIRPVWQKHCRDYFRILDYSIIGWLNWTGYSQSDLSMYTSFSGDGVGSIYSQQIIDNVPFSHNGGDFGGYSTSVINNATGVNFASYETCLWTPTFMKNLRDYWGTTNNHQFLDAPTFYYLLRYYLGGNNNYRAAWVGDTIPRIMASGHTYSATVTVRNDGWDTWTAASLYKLGYAIVNSGATVANSNYGSTRFTIPSGSVAPGGTVTFNVSIVAPSTNGKYDLYYDIVKDTTWFHDLNNIEWKKEIIVATNTTDVDTDGDGVPDVTEDANGTIWWNPDDGTVSMPPVDVDSIAAAKSEDDGTSVSITNGMIVTAVFNGSFYMEEINRQSGIKVISNDAVVIGSKVTLTGVMGTSNGERQITATSAPEIIGSGSILPLGMTNKAIGGTSITDGTGVGNVGILVRTWGAVVDNTHSGYIVINDGSGSNIKVDLSHVSNSIGGTSFVTITGICSAESNGGVVTPVIIPRGNSDVSW
ncbi:MAG: carboxypeptidase regulatory-like domain-containing protein [Armatimonadota bacterium]